MLVDELNDRVKHLSQRISRLREKNIYPARNHKILRDELEWCATKLIVELLLHSNQEKTFPTRGDLNHFHETYPNKNEINLSELFNRLWLREVIDRVNIPVKISTFYNDLKHFEKQGLPEGTRQEWVNYYNYLKQNKNCLDFISDFHHSYSTNSKGYYIINKKTAHLLIEQHKSFFDQCPTVEDFLNGGFFTLADNNYLYRISGGEDFNYWESFKDRVLGLLWEKMANSNSCLDKCELLDKWLDFVMVNTGHPFPMHCIEFMSEITKKHFLQLIQDKVLNEKDLKDSEREIEKIWLEGSLFDGRRIVQTSLEIKFTPEQSLVEKFRIIRQVKNIVNGNFLIDQRCRYRTDLLITILIGTGKSEVNDDIKQSFQRTISLLKESITRPHLLYKITEFLTPEIIPYLLIHKDMEQIGIALLDKVELSDTAMDFIDREKGYELKSKLWLESVEIILIGLAINHSSNRREKAELILSILSELAANTFQKPLNNNYIEQKIKDAIVQRYRDTWNLIRNFRKGITNYGPYGVGASLLILDILKELTDSLINLSIPPCKTEFYTPPLWLLDLHIRLIEVTQDQSLFNRKLVKPDNPQSQKDLEAIASYEKSLIKNAFKLYLGFFSTKNINVVTHSLKIQNRKARFYPNCYGIELIEWISLVSSLNLTQLQKFINAVCDEFELNRFEDVYALSTDPEINELSEKYYYHTRVLNTVYRELTNAQSSEELLAEIEKYLTRIMCDYSKNVISENKIDVLVSSHENITGENLFEDLMESVVHFSPENRTKIIDAISKNISEIRRVFFAFSMFNSEGDREVLQAKINKSIVEKYLIEQYWPNDIQQILLSATNSKELTDFAEQILIYADSVLHKNEKKELKTERLYFQVKLMLAYRRKDRAAITYLMPPANTNQFSDENAYYEDLATQKLFEAAILLEEGKYNEAYQEFSKLLLTNSEDVQIANLRFSAAVELAKEVENFIDRSNKLLKALEEWEKFRKRVQKEKFKNYNPANFQINLLECLNLLQRHEEFDVVLSEVKKIDRFSKPFAQVIVKNRIDQSRHSEAIEFINQLEKYHRYRSGRLPDFVTDLRKAIGTEDNLKFLKSKYDEILNQTPENLIKILPAFLCSRTRNIGEFLLNEILIAAKKIQSKPVFVDIKLENKITDVLQLLINARLSSWRMEWSSQERQGVTSTGKNPASVDLALNLKNYSVPLEAIRFVNSFSSMKKKLEEHIFKNFNQTADRKFLFNVIYYQHSHFLKDWSEFSEKFLATLKFRKDFERKGPIEIIDWESISPNLKVCKTDHNNGVVCYYIFIDFTLYG